MYDAWAVLSVLVPYLPIIHQHTTCWGLDRDYPVLESRYQKQLTEYSMRDRLFRQLGETLRAALLPTQKPTPQKHSPEVEGWVLFLEAVLLWALLHPDMEPVHADWCDAFLTAAIQ